MNFVIFDIPVVVLGISQALCLRWDSEATVFDPSSYFEATALLQSHVIHCVISDLSYKGAPVEALIDQLREINTSVPLIIHASKEPSESLYRAIRKSTKLKIACVSKNEGLEKLVSTIEEMQLAPPQGDASDASFYASTGLTTRESHILRGLVSGCTLKEIAADLRVSYKTISSDRDRIYEKLGFRNLAEAIRYSMDAGLINRHNPHAR